jgi:hypothetical protein
LPRSNFVADRRKKPKVQANKPKTQVISHANTPQAKGRVERANRTLQDRLVKEMRERKISSIEEANKFVKEEFIDFYNRKFSKEPVSCFDAHRSLETSTDLLRILTRYEERTVLKDLSFQFDNIRYQILQHSSSIRGKKVEIRQINGQMHVFFQNKPVRFQELNQVIFKDDKHVKINWKERNSYIPPMNHPWKEPFYERKIKQQAWREVI